eukprot:TRINITY_DN5032_c1_g1_i1.p1 TRINITY_DN5032_c1_g1~~TRINITY_DN5032_c1_g1_i1.p1  ORF type:complete len:191 (+),score=40.66 TRINITY_DN5032_c1_g1_i1:171-743(+)
MDPTDVQLIAEAAASLPNGNEGIEAHLDTIDSQENNGDIRMNGFSNEEIKDFKHVIYNELVKNHNRQFEPKAGQLTLVEPYELHEQGQIRLGFRFNTEKKPEKKIPELYAAYVRKADLKAMHDQENVLIQDLYRYYWRGCTELLGKYFEKKDKYIYLYYDAPLFIANENVRTAQKRLRTMKTKSRSKPNY